MSYFTRSSSAPEERFLTACEAGDYDTAKGLLEGFPNLDVNWVSPHSLQEAPLHLACQKNHVRIVDLLLDHPKIKVNQPGFEGETPILTGLMFGGTDCVRLMLTHKDVNTFVACRHKVQSLVWLLWKHEDLLYVLQEWIGSYKPLPIAPREDEYWNVDAIKEAEEMQLPEIALLLSRYKSDPEPVKSEMRTWLFEGWPAAVFSLVVFLCDDLLRVRKARAKGKIARFFGIACRLHMEMQMVLCERTFGSTRDTIVPDHKEMYLRVLARQYSL